MAERRMFAIRVIESDGFLDMPAITQALYFHLCMAADDDGFVNNPKKIQRIIEATNEDIQLLINKKFIILFESGIVVITHWKIHNYIRNDRYKPTDFLEEKDKIYIKKTGEYSLDSNVNSVQMSYQRYTRCHTNGIPDVIPTVYPGKYSLVKDKIKENNFLMEITKEKTEKKSRKAFPNTKTVKKTLPKNTSKMNRNNVADDTDMIIKQLEESGGENF